MVAEDADAELVRLRHAVVAMREAIDELVETSREFGDGEHHDVIETYRMFAADRGWVTRIADAVRSGLTAEAAVQKVADDTRARMMQVSDPYLRERLFDLEDLANRLQQHFPDGRRAPPGRNCRPNSSSSRGRWGRRSCWITARRRILGLVLEEGSPTAHVAIVARAFDIPVVGRVDDATSRIEAGDIVDRRRRSCQCDGAARAPTSSNLSRPRSRRAAGAAPITRRCARSRRSPATASRSG